MVKRVSELIPRKHQTPDLVKKNFRTRPMCGNQKRSPRDFKHMNDDENVFPSKTKPWILAKERGKGKGDTVPVCDEALFDSQSKVLLAVGAHHDNTPGRIEREKEREGGRTPHLWGRVCVQGEKIQANASTVL